VHAIRKAIPGNAHVGASQHPGDMDPVDVGAGVVELALGTGVHICAMLSTGGARCWGANFYGQLGYSNTTLVGYSNVPADVGEVPYR
jgi:hypothetical protein